MKLISKIFISGKIQAETGLHIGGSKSSLDIGGVDLNVIKDSNGVPFIPGSSLKGKLRSLLAKEEGSPAVDNDSDILKEIFGFGGEGKGKGFVTRLIVRDASLDQDHFKQKFDQDRLELDFTETKWENTVDRIKGTAKHPRQLERVPAGTEFNLMMVYDNYDDEKTKLHIEKIMEGLRLLEDDYIGGNGSRGYGRISLTEFQLEEKTIEDYYRKSKEDQKVNQLNGYSL